MTDDTNEVDDFNVFDDSIDLDADDKVEAAPEADGDDELKGDKQEADAEMAEAKKPEPPSVEDEKTVGQLAALKAERQARQKAEEEYRRLKSQYEPDVDPNEPNPSEDPEGYKQWAKAKASQELLVDRINNSRTEMLKVDDYEDMESVFATLATRNPELINQMNKHPDPARFAYETAQKHEQAKEEKIRQKIMAELGYSKDKDAKPKKPKAPDLTGATAIGSNKTKVETMADDDDLFEDSPYRIGARRK
jgi:hypothetical protein